MAIVIEGTDQGHTDTCCHWNVYNEVTSASSDCSCPVFSQKANFQLCSGRKLSNLEPRLWAVVLKS